ncbi:MAG TPA: hypothetical protein VEG63_04140 [Candidatus Acidoferrales bacterium]|nr:hypothetical protein [Candidatus Acidoferrales bacterium]
MLSEYSNVLFANRSRAEANLALIKQRLPSGLRGALAPLLAQMPAPDDALNYLERFFRPDGGAPPDVLAFLEVNPASLHYLLTVFSYSRFLSETLLQQPELLMTVLRPRRPGQIPARGALGIERMRTVEELRDEFTRFQTASRDTGAAVLLARFKRREYLRIMLRDVLKLATLAEVTLELSQLADLLLECALQMGERTLAAAYGQPQSTVAGAQPRRSEFAVLALGKLGGNELNYCSDIDLMFLYAADGETSGGAAGTISNREYFIRLAQALLKLIAESTPEGAVFRVDLRLRPQGSEGELVISVPAAVDYYRTRAREWELQTLIRARGCAGGRETARLFLKEVRPLVYQREFRLEVVEAVLNAREQITRTLSRRHARRRARRLAAAVNLVRQSPSEPPAMHVKLSPGGIRDIEFLAQCLQRLYGGEDPWLQAAPTLVALQRLHDKGHVSGHDFHLLASAYEFLRTIEHRMQLRDGLQRHQLPEPPDSLDRLARRCGIEAAPGTASRSLGSILLARLAQHLDHVREIYNRLLLRQRPEGAGPRPRTRAAAAEDSAGPALLRRLDEEFPALGAEAAQLTAGLESASFLRRGLLRYLASALLSPAVMERLEAEPECLRRAAALFERSDLAVDLLCRHPEGIEQIAAAAPHAQPMLPFFRTMAQRADDLRCEYRVALLPEVAAQLLGVCEGPEPPPFPFLARFTSLAENALRQALRLAVEETFEGASDARTLQPFAVLALGRMGSREMSIGSDADLLFAVADGLTVAELARWRRTAEHLVQLVSSHTREGVLFAVDTRLRPRGTEGELVPTVESLVRYLSTDAAPWEAITFLKLRPVAGNLAFGARVVEEAQAALRARYAGPAQAAEMARELVRIRTKVEQDSAAPRAKGRFKKMPGGFYDLEYIIGYLAFSRAVGGEGGNTLEQIAPLARAGALDAQQADDLRLTAMLYRATDHATRLITGRPMAGWPEPALTERITRLLRQWELNWQGELRPLMEERGRLLRALYLEILSH